MVVAGLPLELRDRPHPTWTVERANRVMHVDTSDLAVAAELAALPPLAASWRATLLKRVERNAHPDPAKRPIGPNEP